MKRILLDIVLWLCCGFYALAQVNDAPELNNAAQEPSPEDLEVLTLDDDSTNIGRFHQPIKFSREELNRIRDPRVRDDYWYALNDSTDKERYLKVHYAFNKARDNWSFLVGGGVNHVYLCDEDFEGKLDFGPVVEFGFKKDIHPYWSLRGMLAFSSMEHRVKAAHVSTFNKNDNPTGGLNSGAWWQRVSYSNFSFRADMMLNVANLLAGRERLYNSYDPYLYVGSGCYYSAKNLRSTEAFTFAPFWMVGFQQYFNFGHNKERFAFYLDANGSWQGGDLEGFQTQVSALRFTVTAGLCFRFSDKIHFQRLGYDGATILEPAAISNVSDDGDDISTYMVTHRQDTVAKLPADLIQAAFFQIDRVELAHTYVLNLGFYAKMINQYPNQKFLVRGFADLEKGSLKRNEWLSRKRAEVVFDVLTKTYGVNPDQLVVEAGDLNDELPFMREMGHHKFNRCVIVAPLDEEYRGIINTTDYDDESELMDGRVSPRTPRRGDATDTSDGAGLKIK